MFACLFVCWYIDMRACTFVMHIVCTSRDNIVYVGVYVCTSRDNIVCVCVYVCTSHDNKVCRCICVYITWQHSMYVYMCVPVHLSVDMVHIMSTLPDNSLCLLYLPWITKREGVPLPFPPLLSPPSPLLSPPPPPPSCSQTKDGGDIAGRVQHAPH